MNAVEYLEINFDLTESVAKFHADQLQHLKDSVIPGEETLSWRGYTVTARGLAEIAEYLSNTSGSVIGGYRIKHIDGMIIFYHPFIGTICRATDDEDAGRKLWLDGGSSGKSFIIQRLGLKRKHNWHPPAPETTHDHIEHQPEYNYFTDIIAFGGKGGRINQLPLLTGLEKVLSYDGYDITVNDLRMMASGIDRLINGSTDGVGSGVKIGDGWLMNDGYANSNNSGYMLLVYTRGKLRYAWQMRVDNFYHSPQNECRKLFLNAPPALQELWVKAWSSNE